MLPPLRDVLNETIESVKLRENHALEALLDSRGRRVVLFGSGTLGRRALVLLSGIGAQVLAFSDNNSKVWGTSVENVPVLAPAQAAERYGKDAVFFVTIWNDHHWFSQTYSSLTALGCTNVCTYAPIYWYFADSFMTLLLLNEPPHRLYQDIERVFAAETLWADQESLDTYRSNILFRAMGDASALPGPPQVSTYFPADLFTLEASDLVLDCGAFDGDTIREILALYPECVKAVYAVEADDVSFDKLQRYIAELPKDLRERMHPLRCAVGPERCVLRFESSGSLTSKAADDGVLVDCFTIDEILQDKSVSLIKMDIEGAEYDALRGGANVIRRDQPILAVCVYHTQSDIWRIPLLVREVLPQHRLFLRAYEGDGFQTVMYAVPPDRLLSVLAGAQRVVPAVELGARFRGDFAGATS